MVKGGGGGGGEVLSILELLRVSGQVLLELHV